MTLHVYNCETVTVRPELVKRTKSEGVFVGLRLHMNTDQTITFWSRSHDGLASLVESLRTTLANLPHEAQALPGQMSA
jgi:hypothetical protein